MCVQDSMSVWVCGMWLTRMVAITGNCFLAPSFRSCLSLSEIIMPWIMWLHFLFNHKFDACKMKTLPQWTPSHSPSPSTCCLFFFCNHFKSHNKGEILMTSLRTSERPKSYRKERCSHRLPLWLLPHAVDIAPLLHDSITVTWAVPGVRLVRVVLNSHWAAHVSQYN